MSGISAIVPTVGRPQSLAKLLESLAQQDRKPDEVIVADCSASREVCDLAGDPAWRHRGLQVRYLHVAPANAVGQRKAAIAAASGDRFLLLDDDVVLAPDCVQHLATALDADPGVAATCADVTNETWPEATAAWTWYLRHVLRMHDGAWHGRVVGPLLRFGYPPRPLTNVPMEWFGTAHTLLRRSAYEAAGGFSEFFLHRSTINEDVDLSLKVARHGRIVMTPLARMQHFHHPGGRVSLVESAEDDIHNRFLILTRTLGRSSSYAASQVAIFVLIETASNVVGAFRRFTFTGLAGRTAGRVRGLARITTLMLTGRA